VQSFSLPANSNVIVAAVDLSSSIPDTGSVTLSVNNSTISTASYGVMSTPASIAATLAANASTSAPVYVAAVNDALYLTSTGAGSSTDSITYSVTNGSYDSTDFSQPSFPYAPISGTLSGDLSGGSSGGSGSPVTVYSYTVPSGGYSANGNLLSYTDSVMGPWSYSYDSLNRVVSGSPASGNTANGGLSLCWSYDAFGNRTAQAAQSGACPAGGPAFPTAAYNTNNQVTFVQNTAPMGYLYDASGDVTSDNTNTYLYDAEGRICAVRSEPVPGTWTMTGYLYDADGTRVAKGTITNWSCDPATSGFSTNNDYILGPGGEQMTEMIMNGTGSALVWEHTNVWAGGKIIATYSQDNTGSQTEASLLHFYLDDPLGSRRAQTDYAGVVEKTCQSLPFGDGETCLSTPTEHLFTGKERDAESGNDYFGARYYSSSVGRFLSPDPMLNSGRPDDPQTWNRYTYALNNPLIVTDPTGLYNLVNTCASDNKQCNSDFNTAAANLKKGVAALTAAVDKLKDGDQKTDLQRALKALGTENDGNNVGVKFGTTSDNSAGQTNLDGSTGKLQFTITFDPSKNGGLTQAINAAHEGNHIADFSDSRYNTNTLSPFSLEYRGYRTSAYATSALGWPSLSYGKDEQYPIWNGSWKAVDKNITRYVTSFRGKDGKPDHPERTPHDPWSK
jgi:RHS repeat-associated protein